MSEAIYFIRSPIFNAKLEVIACELFFARSTQADSHTEIVEKDITMHEIVDCFADNQLQELVDQETTLLPYTQDVKQVDLPFPKGQLIVEVLVDDDNEDQKALSAIRSLNRDGYLIALNNFCFEENWQPMARLADIIKINVSAVTNDELIKQMDALQAYQAKLCAVGIEQYEQFEYCRKIGFDYFQGPFLSKPWRINADEIPANRMVVLNLLAGLLNPEVTPEEIVDLLSNDPRLAYKLLRIINSAAFTLTREIESLLEAVIMLGLNRLRSWASLIALSTIEDKPHELMAVALVRAKMCELIGEALDQRNIDAYFTVGLFSVLDAMLDKPITEIINLLPLSQTVKSALIERSGMLGLVLYNVIAYEQGQWHDIQFTGLSANEYRRVYLDSLLWSKEIFKTLDE
ncbi:MAG: HDOD domain-containing protein [Gammaproteobacteria bacterium]